MPKFPVDAPIDKVLKTFYKLGFELVRKGNHISMIRENSDGTKTPLTMPNHKRIKGSTLRIILNQSRIPRDEFIEVYEQI